MNRQKNSFSVWNRRRQLAAVQALGYVVYWYLHRKYRQKYCHRIILGMDNEKVRDDLMTRLQFQFKKSHRDIIRMGPHAFQHLCDLLERFGGLEPTKHVTIEEQVAKGLYLLSHSATNSEVSFIFRRSSETISRHFHRFLRVVISMEEYFLKQPDGSQVPLEISSSNRFYPYFKDCVGALDGTHVGVKVSNKDAPRYRGRKGYPTLNVLAACTFDLRFTYVLPGWEGTAFDSRIIKNALRREDKLRIPKGKYYLVDAGYMLRSGLIAPYRGVRYHLKEYSKCPPKNARELFNFRHASLRNAIERAFGVVKKRFPIIGNTQPNYSVDTQSDIILACCIIHNLRIGQLHKALEEIGIEPYKSTESYLFLINKPERMMAFFGSPVEYRKETLEYIMFDAQQHF